MSVELFPSFTGSKHAAENVVRVIDSMSPAQQNRISMLAAQLRFVVVGEGECGALALALVAAQVAAKGTT